MPIYDYQCTRCGHRLEELQSVSEPPLTHCPNCNTESLARILGTGGRLIFKGSGFYQTDYKKKSGAGGSETKKAAPGTGTTPEKPEGTKPDKEGGAPKPAGGESAGAGKKE